MYVAGSAFQAVVEFLGGDVDALLDEAAVPLYVLDSAGSIQWMNRRAVEFFGDLVGRDRLQAIAPRTRRLADDVFNLKVTGAEPQTHARGYALRADGTEVLAEFHAVAVRAGDGSIVGVFGVVDTELEAAPLSSVAIATRLTPRQREVLELLSHGYTTQQIAAALSISTHTANNHVRATLRALGVSSRLEAVAVLRGG